MKPAGKHLAAVLATAAAAGMAQPVMGAEPKFPVKPMRFVLGSSPGATADILTRLIGAKMSDAWGQPVVIENRAGASGMLAASVVAKRRPMVIPCCSPRPVSQFVPRWYRTSRLTR